jgi:hypothetical protein
VRGASRLLVAGGGGGGGGGPQDTVQTVPGGWGGPADYAGAPGLLGGNTTYPGTGASRTEVGLGGNLRGCCSGADGVGHNGGFGGSAGTNPVGGGGGGGGWFGGGGGGGEGGNAPTTTGAGGGGGSSAGRDREHSYTTVATVGHTTASRNGRVKIYTMKPATRDPWPVLARLGHRARRCGQPPRVRWIRARRVRWHSSVRIRQ